MNFFADLNVYLLMAVAGFFTGLGNVVGQWFYRKFLEPKLDKVHKKVSNARRYK